MSSMHPIDRRAQPRFPIEAHLEYRSPSTTGRGTTRNISLSGVYIEAPPSVAPRDPIEVRFSLFVGSFDVPFPGEVVRLTEDGFAARFAELGDAQFRVLRRVLPLPGPKETQHPSDAENRRQAERAIVAWLEVEFPECEVEVLRERFLTTFSLLWSERHPTAAGTTALTLPKYLLEDGGAGMAEILRSDRVQQEGDSIREALRRRASLRVERNERGELVAVRIRPG